MPQVSSVDRADGKRLKMQESTDRDADGRRQPPEEEVKRHLSDEEFQSAIKSLEKHPGLVANNLTIRVEQGDDFRVIFILDAQGNTVRRLSENQLWSVIQALDRKTGSLFDKAL